MIRVAAGFCAALAAASPALAQDVPDLVGVWSGATTAVHIGPTPYRPAEGADVTFGVEPIIFTYRIEEQRETLFSGHLSAGDRTETIIGALSPDHGGGYMLDDDGEYSFTLRDENTMDLCYRHYHSQSRVVACWTVTKE